MKYAGEANGYKVYDSYALSSWQQAGLIREVSCGADMTDLCYRYCLTIEEFMKYAGNAYYAYKANELRAIKEAEEYESKITQ